MLKMRIIPPVKFTPAPHVAVTFTSQFFQFSTIQEFCRWHLPIPTPPLLVQVKFEFPIHFLSPIHILILLGPCPPLHGMTKF